MVWTLLRTPAADISVVHNSFARVWSFFVHMPVSAKRILWRGRLRYAAAEPQSTAAPANSLPGMSRGNGRERPCSTWN
jgi:hypothetical protein